MTTTYEVIQRLEALEMNTAQTERMLAALDRIATDLAAIYEVLRDVAEHLEAEDEPEA